jgi:8-oxo-dGTP pyrophosphatase MutT (NUDIX family)
METTMTDDKILGQGKWIKLVERSFTNSAGRESKWEFASRLGAKDTVCMIAIKREPEPTLVLVKQYRVAIATLIVEFPAGLIDPGETPEQAALRELAEETGCIGIASSVAPFTFNSAGICDERTSCVRIDVTSQSEPSHSDDEQIEVITLPLAGLNESLLAIARDGTQIDAKLWFFSEAMKIPR